MTTKLTPIGDGFGVILPPDFVKQVQGEGGGEIEVIRTPQGITIQKIDSAAASQLEIAGQVMKEDASVLRKLAE